MELIGNSGYQLNKWGYGGLGKIYIDVLNNGAIQLMSCPLETDARRRLYKVVIQVKDNVSEIIYENSMDGGNYIFDKPSSNRPDLYDIQRVMNSMPDNFGRDNQNLSSEVLNYIQGVFEN